MMKIIEIIFLTMMFNTADSLSAQEVTTLSNHSNLIGVGQVPPDYYGEVGGLSGDELKTHLHKKICNHKRFTYDQAWDALAKTDCDDVTAENVVLLYTLRSQPVAQRDRGTSYDYTANGYILNDSWNREHVWPKSHGFPKESDTAYTDLHHLRPADRSVNSARNTRSFDGCTEAYLDNGGTIETVCRTSKDQWSWEPPDEVKGDIARMLFYMAVRYEGPDYDLEIVDSIIPSRNKNPIIGKLSTLLEWHKNDPVDNWERRRNHVIYHDFQGNRNPFIDHPEWVELVWGE